MAFFVHLCLELGPLPEKLKIRRDAKIVLHCASILIYKISQQIKKEFNGMWNRQRKFYRGKYG